MRIDENEDDVIRLCRIFLRSQVGVLRCKSVELNKERVSYSKDFTSDYVTSADYFKLFHLTSSGQNYL